MILKNVKTFNNNDICLLSKDTHVAKNCYLVVGTIHGDEPAGFYIINEYLKRNNVTNNVLFIPCLNPDGMANNTRVNCNGVDINRNFPTKNWGQNEGDNTTCDDPQTQYFGGITPASEIETRFLIDTVEKYNPKLVLTLHSPYKVVNYDGPAEKFAQVIADVIGYPIEKSIGYPTPGSFGTFCGIEKNIPVITLELDDQIPVENLYSPMFDIFEKINAILQSEV